MRLGMSLPLTEIGIVLHADHGGGDRHMGAVRGDRVKLALARRFVLDELIEGHRLERFAVQAVEHRLGVAEIDIGARRLAGGGFLNNPQHQRLHVGARRVLAFQVEFVFLVHVGDDFFETFAAAEACLAPLAAQGAFLPRAFDQFI